MYSQLLPGTKEFIKTKIEVFNKAGLSDAVEEEEAKLAQLISVPDTGWLIEYWLPLGHKGQITGFLFMIFRL